MGAHQVTHFQYYSPELLIVLSNRRTLPQVKQLGVVLQGMLQVMELSFQCMTKVLPSAYSQLGPIFVCHGPPPSQGLACQQGDSHFDNLCWLHHNCHFAELLDVECPVCQLLGVPIKLVWLL